MTRTEHNVIIPYTPELRLRSRQLRKGSTLGEVILWKHIKGRAFGWQFHRQVPMDKFIVDFYCHELFLEKTPTPYKGAITNQYTKLALCCAAIFPPLQGGVGEVKKTLVRNNITGVLNALQKRINEIAEGREPKEHVRRSVRVAGAQGSAKLTNACTQAIHPPAPL